MKKSKTKSKVDCIIEGLEIFKKYGEVEVAAEHDVFYAGPWEDMDIKGDDAALLEKLGWTEGEYGWEIFT